MYEQNFTPLPQVKPQYTNEKHKMITFERKVSHQLNLEIISSGQIFGFEDVLKNRCYSKQVKCISAEAFLYVIPSHIFFEKLMGDETTSQYLN